jgi:P27 family predicted phage terminase small subunit
VAPDDTAGWEPPGHLPPDAVGPWRHLVDKLAEVGNLSRVDPMLIEAYATNVALFRRAQAELSAGKLTSKNRAGTVVVNPACNVVNTTTMRIKAIVYDLGLCPATSKYAAGKGEGETDKWGGLFSLY